MAHAQVTGHNGHGTLRLLVAAGGTGGHLYPALRLIEAVRAQDPRVEATLVTTDAAHDAALVRGYGPVDGVRVASLHVRPRASNTPAALLRFVWQLTGAWWRAMRLVVAVRPQVVVGFGSYISAPVVLAERLAGCRVLLYEQNVVPEQANRWLAPLAHRVAVSCPQTLQRWRGGAPRVLTGNPVRPAIGAVSRPAGREAIGLTGGRRTVLVLGGSRGARALNRLMLRVVSLWSPAQRAACQIFHLTGPDDTAMVAESYAQAGMSHRVLPFCDRMAEAYAAADVVVARAGATTLAELALAGRPAALIPYPYGDGHQRHNARWWVEAGAATLFDESTLTVAAVSSWLSDLLQDGARLDHMGAQAATLAVPEAAQRLAGEVLRLAGRTPVTAPAPAAPVSALA